MLGKFTKIPGAPFIAIAALLMLFVSTSAFGADIVKADVPFAFTAGTKSMPAGGYEFQIDRAHSLVTILSTAQGKVTSAMAPIITELAPPPHGASDHAHIVFDKAGSTYTLSEVWQPDREGLLVHATKGAHEHHVIHAKK